MNGPTLRGSKVPRGGASATPVRRPVGARPPAPTAAPGWFTDQALPVAVGITIALVLLGFVVGSFGAFAHATKLAGLPVGLVVVLLAQGGVVGAVGVFTGARSGAALPVVGWLLSVLVFSSGRPEGSLIIAPDTIGIAYLFGGLAVFGSLAALPYAHLARPGGRSAAPEPKR